MLVRSERRVLKERSMRRRRLNKLWKRLGELRRQSNRRDQLMLKLGAAKKDAGRAWFLVEVQIPKTDEELAAHGLTYRLRREKLRQVFRREGRYLLRSNMTSEDPAELWRHYMQLTEIEQAFKELKHNLAIRPIFHQLEERIEAHIFVSFIAYCLLVTLKNLARPQAPGLTPRAILEKFATFADGRHPCADHRRAPSDAAAPYPTEPRARATPASTPTEVAEATPAQAPDLKPPCWAFPVAPCSADLWRSDNGKSMRYHLFKCRVGEVGLRLDWRKQNLKKVLRKVYRYRSRALHEGVPFPDPMLGPPFRLKAKEAGSEVPLVGGGSYSMGATWVRKDVPLNLNTFHYITRNALLNWWDNELVKTQ